MCASIIHASFCKFVWQIFLNFSSLLVVNILHHMLMGLCFCLTLLKSHNLLSTPQDFWLVWYEFCTRNRKFGLRVGWMGFLGHSSWICCQSSNCDRLVLKFLLKSGRGLGPKKSSYFWERLMEKECKNWCFLIIMCSQFVK